jgi:trehalose synthase
LFVAGETCLQLSNFKESNMLPKVAIGRHCCAASSDIENYRTLVGDPLVDEILELGRELRGVRLCQLNATSSGGGVAELLSRQLPLYQSLGIEADWRIIHGNKDFFTVTKSFHNALQGAEVQLTTSMRERYLDNNRQSAELLEEEYDVYFVHDPQPAAVRHFARRGKAKWIWRCHIDSSEPNHEVWEFLRQYVQIYDAAVFTLEVFRPPDLAMKHVAYIPPAIDPLATKNMDLPHDLCRRVMADNGVNLREPILLQVSRFDPWKDPLGVISAYRLVKQQRPGVQLALVGAMAGDDPEGWTILETINSEAVGDPDLYVFTNMTGVGNMEVNAFQRGADVIIQKSLREGFGLVVSEALWKEKPIVAGAAGGIPMQFPAGYEENLVDGVEQCAQRVLFLLDNPDAAARFGRAGREKVRQEFLLPRLIRDDMRLIRDVLRG